MANPKSEIRIPNSVAAEGRRGQFQFPICTVGIAMAGNVRVGLEDNIYYDYERTQLTTNRKSVERIVRIATEIGRPIATPAQTREMLGLPAVKLEPSLHSEGGR